MFILEKPYVSQLLKQTVIRRNGPVLDNDVSRSVFAQDELTLASSAEFTALAGDKNAPRIYSNSENAVDWIARHLGHTDLPDKVNIFKDKVRFRELVRDMYPAFVFQSVALEALDSVDPTVLPKPFIIKPAVGFFSLGVHVVASDDEWPATKAAIREEIETIKTHYPEDVLNVDRFIIEESVPGEEFAVDAYFDTQGNPVILNILGHLFASAKDVSDRIYYTAPSLIEKHAASFQAVLAEVGKRAELRNFPVHAELRVDEQGKVGFIEINPMRFAGWCCTDIAHHAYGINPYDCFLDDTKPDWDTILAKKEKNACCLVVADIPHDVDRSRLQVDYDAFSATFSRPLELRPIDFTEYPVFAFMICQVPESNLHELNPILKSDLREFMTVTAD